MITHMRDNMLAKVELRIETHYVDTRKNLTDSENEKGGSHE